ncbi:hypothetical protein AB5I41_22835 [Sphingomonas sp. MMS24-JH45]
MAVLLIGGLSLLAWRRVRRARPAEAASDAPSGDTASSPAAIDIRSATISPSGGRTRKR